MRCLNELVIAVTIWSCIANFAMSQVNEPGSFTDASIAVVDGALTLNGTFRGLSGIQALSPAGHLSIATTNLGGEFIEQKSPFAINVGHVVWNSPTEAVIGVLGADNRINVEGQTITSILYGAAEEVAASDLTFNVGVGDCTSELGMAPSSYVCEGTGGGGTGGGGTGGGGTGGGGTGGGGTGGGGETGEQYYTIDHGTLTLNGTFNQLAGIEAKSNAGHLAIADFEIAPGVPVAGRAPFSFSDGNIVQNTPDSVLIGVLGANKRIDLEGTTATSILYKAETAVALGGDLTVNLGLGDEHPAPIPGRLLGDGRDGGYTGGGGTGGGGTTTTGSLSGVSASIVDGFLTFEGTIHGLAAIEAKSTGEYLSLERVSIPDIGDFDSKAPFSLGSGIAIANRPSNIAIGVLGPENRIDLEGTTRTAIMYSESQAVAAGGDLSVGLGISICPVNIPLDGTTIDFTCTGGNPSGGGGTGGGGTGGGGESSPHFRVVEGEIRLVGDIEDLSSVRIWSPQGSISLEGPTIESNGVAPFPPQTGLVVNNQPESVVLGVLRAADRIDIEGETKTSILYSESLETATGDLVVNIGAGDSSPYALPIGGRGDFEQGVIISDGVLTFVGDISQLAGIEAVSEGGFLSLESMSIEAPTTLFSASGTSVTTNEEGEIIITAASVSDRISVNGEIRTGIYLSGGGDGIAFSDLVVSIGLGDDAPISVPLANVLIPEPSANILCLFAVLGLLLSRRRR